MSNPELNKVQDEYIRVPETISLDSLIETLVNANIPVDQYGVDGAKTVQHLLNEILDGESTLSVNSKGELLRELSVLWVDVFCKHSSGETFLLKEEVQIFKDGRERRRELGSSLGEKLKPGEGSESAVYRALSEELGIDSPLQSVEYQGEAQKLHTPEAFPGLESTYQFYKYSVVISEEDFKPEGYIEYQEDKTNYYTWGKIGDS